MFPEILGVLLTQDALEEQVVLPCAGNFEVLLGNTDGLESSFAQYLLGSDVVQQRACFDAVQTEILMAVLNEVSQGRRGEALSGVVFVDPVTDARALEGSANDSGESHSADDSGTVHEDKRIAGSGFQLFKLARQDPSLIDRGEERLRTCRLPWSKMFAVSFIRIENWSNVSLGQQSKSDIIGKLNGVGHRSMLAVTTFPMTTPPSCATWASSPAQGLAYGPLHLSQHTCGAAATGVRCDA